MSNIFDLFKKIERRESTAPVSAILVGLGNPGLEYERTRHNVGFVSIDYIAEKLGARIDRLKFHALVGEATVGESRVLLMKPTTYMNNSGVAVQEAAAFYKISPERVIVLHDEISFEPGKIRLRRKGSAGGHNGLKSIIAHLSSEEFPRVKIGVGKKPNPEYDLADWVLGTFDKNDMELISQCIQNTVECTELIVGGNTNKAMEKYN